jgi:hypothetical protein
MMFFFPVVSNVSEAVPKSSLFIERFPRVCTGQRPGPQDKGVGVSVSPLGDAFDTSDEGLGYELGGTGSCAPGVL